MPINDALGQRMKQYYEFISRTKLMRRTPVAIRIDGKAFHSFTRGFVKPFDNRLIHAMNRTMYYLCENIQGCVFGYTQSDEITLILVDYNKLDTEAWYDYEVQKICSIVASMATMKFNKVFAEEVESWKETTEEFVEEWDDDEDIDKFYSQVEVYKKAIDKGAMFDARCFNIPKEEVTNLIYWRQLDASRNSINMVGRAYFSHKELEGKNTSEVQDMLFTKHGVIWNDFTTRQKRGGACRKQVIGINERPTWVLDLAMPILKGEDRKYIDELIINIEEE